MTFRVGEIESLSQAVSDFAEAMRQKLWKKAREGYGGWNDDSDMHLGEDLRDKLFEHVEKYLGRSPNDGSCCEDAGGVVRKYRAGDPAQLVDIANLTMMLWRIEVKRLHPLDNLVQVDQTEA